MFPLVFGAFLVPGTANAGFFDGFLANEASAEVNTPLSDIDNKNSQSKSLSLEATVSGASILEDKKEAKAKDTKSKANVVKEDADVNIVSENALLPTTGLLGVADEDFEDFSFDSEPELYVVKKGNTASQIADLFDVSVDTILSANKIPKGTKTLKEGTVLLILPFSGIDYTVVKGDTVQSIAKKYGVNSDKITLYNDITEKTKLAVGDSLLIPDASLPNEVIKKAPKKGTTSKKVISGQIINRSDNDGYFINPVPNGRKGRGTSLKPQRHKGVDIGAPMGTPIYAAASGTVVIADAAGYNGGYGKYVGIRHNNGTTTIYAHMSSVKTRIGEQVAQGEVIGLVGSTGRSTGPHCHFEVLEPDGNFFANPGNTWNWKPWSY